jgi:hypothetical protein
MYRDVDACVRKRVGSARLDERDSSGLSTHRVRSVRSRVQSGAVLIIALTLMVILTVLATAGMSMSSAEIAMAGNEQFRREAGEAASAGIEESIGAIARVAPVNGTLSGEGAAGSRYLATARYVGQSPVLPNFSAGRFIALHYEIESEGHAGRHAQDTQRQGVALVLPADDAQTFVQHGSGLSRFTGQ